MAAAQSSRAWARVVSNGLRLVQIGVSLGLQPLFAEVSVEVQPGEIATVMGPSGSGKSTLLSFVCGTLDPVFQARGQVIVAGRASRTTF